MTDNPQSFGTPETPGTPAPPGGVPYPGPPAYSYPPGPYGAPGAPGAPGPYGPYPGAYPPPPMGYGEYPGAPLGAPRNGLGTASLVTGLIGLVATLTVFGGIGLGIIAVILGIIGLGRVKRGEANNRGVALTGVIIGALAVVISIGFLLFGFWAIKVFGGESFKSFTECVQEAGNDKVAVQQCQDEFEQSVSSRLSQVAPTP